MTSLQNADFRRRPHVADACLPAGGRAGNGFPALKFNVERRAGL